MHFQAREKSRQETYRQRYLPEFTTLQQVSSSARSSLGRIPRGHEAKAFFPPSAMEILAYGREHRLPVEAEARNLKSSLVACLNLLFPLRGCPELALLALAPLLPGVARVLRQEFLYPIRPASAGTGMPVACHSDAAIWWEDGDGRQRLSLCCWSYVESSYGTCGGFRSRENLNQGACLYRPANDPSRFVTCHMSRKNNSWLFWKRLPEAGVDLDAAIGVAGCLFRGPFYQLLRYFMLAALLRHMEPVVQVDVVAAVFRGNDQLRRTPRHLAVLGDDIIDAWNRLLSGVPHLRCITVEEIVAGLRRDRSDAAMAHVSYLEGRYGV